MSETQDLFWMRLDNSAKIYPMLLGKDTQNIYSLSAELKDNVDPEILSDALHALMPRFPSFNVRLKKGIFWYYFEEQTVLPQVFPETPAFLKTFDFKENRYFNFRVTYFKNRINLDIFHVLTDGFGAMCFLQCLLWEYLQRQNLPVGTAVLDLAAAPSSEETEDAFLRYYRKKKLRELKISALKGKKALKIEGTLFSDREKGVTHYCMDAGNVVMLAHKHQASVTQFLSALLLQSILSTQPKDTKRNAELFVPINLRKILPSRTLRNFTLFSRVSANAEEAPDLDGAIKLAKEAFASDTQKEVILDKISTTVKAEKFLPMRLMPLPLKHLIFKISGLFFGRNKKTLTFSNLGAAKLDPALCRHIDNLYFSLTSNRFNPLNVTAISFENKLNVTFTRSIVENKIETYFENYLKEAGVSYEILSNEWERQHTYGKA